MREKSERACVRYPVNCYCTAVYPRGGYFQSLVGDGLHGCAGVCLQTNSYTGEAVDSNDEPQTCGVVTKGSNDARFFHASRSVRCTHHTLFVSIFPSSVMG